MTWIRPYSIGRRSWGRGLSMSAKCASKKGIVTGANRLSWPSRWRSASLEVFRSEEHTSELQSLMRISYAVFCLKKKNQTQQRHRNKSTITYDLIIPNPLTKLKKYN